MKRAKIISVLNNKGGVGKSTIVTNIAGYFANKGNKVVIGDFDAQQSSKNWLSQRPKILAPIHTLEIINGKFVVRDKDVDYIIIDSPAGIHIDFIKKIIRQSNKIIVPLKPSFFDMFSTKDFLEKIIEIINEQGKEIDICLVGNMVVYKTKANEQLQKFIESCGLDNPTMIRQTQIYVNLAAHGLTIFDSKSNFFEKDIEQWMPLIKWIEK